MTVYSKSIANINLNGDKLKATHLNSGARQGCPLPPFLFNVVLKILVTAIGILKKIKGIQ